jgi:thymidylate synthase (FAD)
METRRPTVPAAEEILGGYFPVLDHGFISLVDYMGSDEDVERAARVSYGYGTRQRSATRGLIRYLRRHRHSTPTEMVEFKFHCSMPMFVARQWIRHRTACLAEGTEVYFDLPGGIDRRGNQLYKLKVEDLWERFQPTKNRHRPDKQRDPWHRRRRVQGMRLRQVNEDNLRIQHTRVVDVWKSGAKPVFRMVLSDGKAIECTADHRFLFADGWKTLAEATGLTESGGRAVWRKGTHELHVNGMVMDVPGIYRDATWLERQYSDEGRPAAEIAEECGVSEPTIRKWLRKHGIRRLDGTTTRFTPGGRPWNAGKTYELGPRDLSPAWVEANRRARSGPDSNFWRGGVSTDREGIARWTSQRAHRIHERNGWTCQLCGQRKSELHCHHVIPVWAEPALGKEESNLTTLCGECHRGISGRELEVAEKLTGAPILKRWDKRPRVPWNRLTVARLVSIERFEYVGVRETYDLEVEGPYHNFVANGIVTHNSVNEYSGRYSLMPLLFHTPAPEDFALQSPQNNQGRKGEAADPELWNEAVRRWNEGREAATGAYTWMLGEDVAREIARIDLPLSTFTQWYWKIDLHNLLHFLSLRVDPHAQWEIRAYAQVMAGIVKRVAPLSYEAWVDYDLTGTSMSRGELEALRALLARDAEDGVRARPGTSLDAAHMGELGLSGREIREFLGKLDPAPRPDFELDLSTMRSAEAVAESMARAVPRVERVPVE